MSFGSFSSQTPFGSGSLGRSSFPNPDPAFGNAALSRFGSPARTAEPFFSGFGSLTLESERKIIVGVDYGTTYTGASYVSSKGKGLSDIVLISTWPGPSRETETVLKAPSRIAYTSDNPRVKKDKWGYEVDAGKVAYSWTKLLLDQSTPLTRFDDPALEAASQTGILKLPQGKSAVDVVADYLSHVYTHIIKTLEKNITEQALRATPLEFWFTVLEGKPAGPYDKLFLISEPEAATITALRKYTTGNMGGSIKAGDGVLVCDCGGGTVDITTYLVSEVSPVLKFDELCTGIGGKCGSTAIDRNFYRLMSNRFGNDFDKLPSKKKAPGSDFMRKFELIKRDFGYSEEEDTIFELPLSMTLKKPDPEHFEDDEQMVLLSSKDMRAIFDPVVEQIIRLVKKQIKDANTESGRNCIKSFKDTFRSIAITVPDSPQAAIVQGAALCGLEGLQSTTRRSRRHYGISWGIPFREGVDEEINFYIDFFTGQKKVRGMMEWMIAKGDKYTPDYTRSVSIGKSHTRIEGVGKQSLRSSSILYACDLAIGPERVDAAGVYEVGRIDVDFSAVDLTRFESKPTVLGNTIYKIIFQLKVIFGAHEGLLKFEAASQGQVIGKTTIDFNTAKCY
ncbi:hypothetical protein BJY04DRAFT_218627 [Aspergillus karnatakaensis]|uniref:Hsp70 family protein n=1 Tax=Aspergillus karnatakaensis TaxID=1810916 RepID=UPI003CCCEEE0